MNTWSWIAWLVTALTLISSGRNPMHLSLVWLALLLIYTLWMDTGQDHLFLFSPMRLSLFMCLTAALFNALTSHFGETVLATIPGRLPLISGPITLEAVIYGAINGLVLASILTAFLVINLTLPTHVLVRLIPRAYYSLAIVISIAVTFMPSTRRQFQQVREAQAIRGRRLSGIRDYLALFMPVLIGGLEQAMQLAETMTARGFAGAASTKSPGSSRALMLAGLLLVLAGWVVGWLPAWSWGQAPLLLLGGLFIAFPMWLVGRRSPRTSYQPESWRWVDGIALLAAGSSILLFQKAVPGINYSALSYSPYPSAAMPGFEPALGLAVILILYPILAYSKGQS